MSFTDFRIKYDPNKDTEEELTKKILYSVIVRRLQFKKPAVIFIGGDSGEGKSFSGLRLQELLLSIQGLDIRQYLDVMNVYTPLEYPKKINKLLYDKEYKKCNIITIHEARELVKAKLWQSFLTQSIADINAMSRSIKQLCIIIISQFIRDISTDIRYTLNFYIKVNRAMGGNKRARLYIYKMWKDDRDLEKPRLRKRRLSGYVIYPDGTHRRYTPRYLEVKKPDKDIIEIFEKADTTAKSQIIKRKIDKLVKEMEKDIDIKTDKIETMVSWYSEHLESLSMISQRKKDKLVLKHDVYKMHDLSASEAREFEEKLNLKLIAKGAIEPEPLAEVQQNGE